MSTLFAHSFAPWQRVKYVFQRVLEGEHAKGEDSDVQVAPPEVCQVQG